MSLTRRAALRAALYGASGLGLRALATGLPISLLSRSPLVWADPPACAADAQHLILSLSAQGDPVNANAPGTYDYPDIVHPPDPRLAPTALVLAGKRYTATRAWAALPQAALDRTCFFHHATLTSIHPNLPKVMQLMGATAGSEMLPSICAKALAPCLQTIQTEPVVVGAGEVLTFEGRGLPSMPATALRDILSHRSGGLRDLQKLRDQSLDEVHAILRQGGTRAQRDLLDRLARSHQQARSLSDQLLSNIAAITSDESDGQIIAAATLIKMNVTPVVAISIGFGADNHTDPGLQIEANATLSGTQRIADLLAKLAEYGLQDRVTFAMLNVFGRTLKRTGLVGRDHWGNHHTTVLIGKRVRGGVVGGIAPQGADYSAQPIDARTGAGSDSGDVPLTETLGALGKTLGAALGVPAATLDRNIALGKIIPAALA